MSKYWEQRFQTGGKIWGERPSQSAFVALARFKALKITTVFIPGAGYGRNSRLFSSEGLRVQGVEQSETAVRMAQTFDPQSQIRHGSFFELSDLSPQFDAIYGFNIFHLFLKADREKFLTICDRILKPRGIIFLTAFSDREPSFGHGHEVEPHTFESKPGRPVHYFSQEELIGALSHFTVCECALIEDPEDHGEEGPHIHQLFYILAQKKAQKYPADDPLIYPREPAQLRKVILEKRNLIPPNVRSSHFQKIMAQFLQTSEYRQASHIIGYYGKTSSGEFDTRPLLHHILSEKKTLLLPRCSDSEIALDIYKITDLQKDVELGAYSIHEPRRSCPLMTPPDNCLILVPGSVFDLSGARYGYGAGFYDNFLQDRQFVKIAFALDCCVMDFSLQTHAKDIFMDVIITESQVYRVNKGHTRGYP